MPTQPNSFSRLLDLLTEKLTPEQRAAITPNENFSIDAEQAAKTVLELLAELDKSDPKKAKLFRDKLKKLARRALRLAVNPAIIPPKFTIKKVGFTLPQVWPLSIDTSFWEDWAFIKWQALRRNHLYRRSIKRFYKPNPAIFQSSEISHLFQDYSPSFGPANNPFSAWRHWAIRRSAKLKTSDQIEREIAERLHCTIKGF